MDKTIPDLTAGSLTSGSFFPIATTAHIEATRSTPDALAVLIDDIYYKGTARNLFGVLGKDLVVSGANSDLTVHGKIIQGTTSTSSSVYSAILAQNSTITSSLFCFIGGGDQHAISFGDYSAILGGIDNGISDSLQSTIGGGINNNLSSTDYSAIFGGSDNTINNTNYSTIFGCGTGNIQYSSDYSSLLGGYQNTIDQSNLSAIIGGGVNTITGSSASVIVGGGANKIKGTDSVILGGAFNVVSGDYAYAAGYKSKVPTAHNGAMVFSDSQNIDKFSYGADTFSTYFTGGFHVFDGNLFVETGIGYPTAQTTAGVPGQFAVTGNYLFISTGNNQWGRVCLDWTGNLYSPAEATSRYTTSTTPVYPTATFGIMTGVGTGCPVIPLGEPPDTPNTIWRKVYFENAGTPKVTIPAAGYYKVEANINIEMGSMPIFSYLRLRNSTDNFMISGAYDKFMQKSPHAYSTKQVKLEGINYFAAGSKTIDIEYIHTFDPADGTSQMSQPNNPIDVTYFSPTGTSISYIKLSS